jgi:hypothetical protein
MLYNKYYNLQKSVMISGVLIVFLTISSCVDASEMTHGEMQSAIRGANLPCAKVIDLESAGDNNWIVKCNSGKFQVTRDKSGKFTVSQIE